MAEGVSRYTEAVTTAFVSQQVKRELYEQVGRAIVELSGVEMLLAILFAIITPREVPDVATLFWDQNGLEKRIRLIDFMAKGELNDREMSDWQHIRNEIMQHKGVRNLVAHQRLTVEGAMGEIKATLQPPWLKKGGKKLDIEEIRRTADAIEKISKELWSFIGTLHQK